MPSAKTTPRRDLALLALSAALIALLTLLALVLHGATASAQTGPDQPLAQLDKAGRAEIIDSVTAALNGSYVFPEVAKEMEKLVRKHLRQGKYDTLSDPPLFTRTLTEDLQSVSHDRHLGVAYFPNMAARFTAADTLTDSMRLAEDEQARFENYGFYRVERLPGNIGYLDFRHFADAERAGPTAVAAMNFLANCDAIIFDLRQNGGGNPSMIQLLTSYLFAESKHLNSFYLRPRDTIHQFWTFGHVPGKRMPEVDVYVLTSASTFSGAEEFAYNLKNLKRGTIIGETTGGGAHPVDEHAFLNLNVGIRIPFGRAINPVTNTNWEGVGVMPDIEVPADQALTVARIEALKKLRDMATDARRKQRLAWELQMQESRLHPVQVDPAALQRYAGTYGPRKIILENGDLFYQREGRPKYRLIPLTADLFGLDGLDYFRLKFVANAQGEVIEVIGVYDDGQEDHSPRTGN